MFAHIKYTNDPHLDTVSLLMGKVTTFMESFTIEMLQISPCIVHVNSNLKTESIGTGLIDNTCYVVYWLWGCKPFHYME